MNYPLRSYVFICVFIHMFLEGKSTSSFKSEFQDSRCNWQLHCQSIPHDTSNHPRRLRWKSTWVGNPLWQLGVDKCKLDCHQTRSLVVSTSKKCKVKGSNKSFKSLKQKKHLCQQVAYFLSTTGNNSNNSLALKDPSELHESLLKNGGKMCQCWEP